MGTKETKQPWRGDDSLTDYMNNVIRAASPEWKRCLRDYAKWLAEERGLSVASITVRVFSLRRFVETLPGIAGVNGLRVLTVTDVEDSFVNFSKTLGLASMRSMQAALRLFFRFATLQEWVRADLLHAVPKLRSYRLSNTPRGLPDEEIRKLLKSPPKSARNHALLLLFVTYGVRRGQVCALRLDDIDWRNRVIVFPSHKGGKAVVHQLTAAVATKIAEYLQQERPKSDEQLVFLRVKRPYWPMSPSAITAMMSNLLLRSGVEFSPRGPHVLRHAFATRLLKQHQPLKVIADLLGHRSLESTSIYAKVDHPRLLEVSVEWPEVTS